MEIAEDDSGIPKVIPMYNSEEKVNEINRLLEILAKRKRYSIVVTMLVVFQKFNFQKLLKDYLIQCVKDFIAANPYKVVSYNGVPFTPKNCFMGMKVIIGKHRIVQKDVIEGNEYLNVNLIHTCIFLSDEIAKISKGVKGSRPIHSSLLDEIEIEEKGVNFGNNNNNNLISEKRGRTESEFGDETYGDDISTCPDKKKNKNGTVNSVDSEESSKKKKSEENNDSKQKSKNTLLGDTIFCSREANFFKCPLQDYLSVWNFGKNSPINLFIKDNIDNIYKIKNIFALIQETGKKGQNYIEDLSRYIPTKDNKNNEQDEKRKQILQNLENINNTYKEYDETKCKLIHIYNRLKITVDNMKQCGYNPDKILIEDDTEYMNMISKRFNDLLKDFYPLFNKIYNYDKECHIKPISNELQILSKTLKENEVNFRLFMMFAQNLVNLFPAEAKNINTLSDLMMDNKLNDVEREQKFYEVVNKEIDKLIKSAEPIKKMCSDGNNTNNNENKNEEATENNDDVSENLNKEA